MEPYHQNDEEHIQNEVALVVVVHLVQNILTRVELKDVRTATPQSAEAQLVQVVNDGQDEELGVLGNTIVDSDKRVQSMEPKTVLSRHDLVKSYKSPSLDSDGKEEVLPEEQPRQEDHTHLWDKSENAHDSASLVVVVLVNHHPVQ